MLWLPILIIFLAAITNIADSINFESAQTNLLWALTYLIIGAIATTAYWIIAVLAIGEPLLSSLIAFSEEDPLLLLWPEEQRSAARCACLTALSIPLLLIAFLTKLPAPNLILVLTFSLVAILYGYSLLIRMLVVFWRFSFSASAVIAAGPAIVAIAMAVALAEPSIAFVTAVILIPILWLTTEDTRQRMMARMKVGSIATREELTAQDLEASSEIIRSAHSPRLAGILLDKIAGMEEEKGLQAIKVNLLLSAGKYIDAVDVGAAAIEAGQSGAELHLAMAEACLRSDDPENAAAHAQEAYELGAGPESLLLLAAAQFCLQEMESGISVCRRIIALGHTQKGKRNKRILRKAGFLLRHFESVMYEEV